MKRLLTLFAVTAALALAVTSVVHLQAPDTDHFTVAQVEQPSADVNQLIAVDNFDNVAQPMLISTSADMASADTGLKLHPQAIDRQAIESMVVLRACLICNSKSYVDQTAQRPPSPLSAWRSTAHRNLFVGSGPIFLSI